MTTHTAAIVAALDDPESEVRAAALDAIGDLHDPASLQGLVVRLHDQTLPRGRRIAAMAAFGSSCEPFLLEMSEIDAANRANYARALGICGTRRARPALCRWTEDPRLEVRVAALTALGHVGLDERAARLAIEALESGDVMVRAKAAFALRGWQGPENRRASGTASRRCVAGRGAGRPIAADPGRRGDRRVAGDGVALGRGGRVGAAGAVGDVGPVLITAATAVLVALSLAATLYLVIWNVLQFALGAVAGGFIWRHVLRRTRRDRLLPDRMTVVPHVSVIVPAYNEALTIVESVRALLALDYESREIVVVNDGSSDDTLAVLQDTFHMVAAPFAFVQPLASEPVRGIYRSIREPALVVIDKQNGGCKSDALNAGINVASGELVLTIDADTVLEPDALSRAVLPFLEDPTTIAVGGNVAIANGCRIEHGRITDVALPRSWLARFQMIEYMRSFLLFRAAWVSTNAVTLISGAFGLFRREAVIAVGGYDRTAIGEDMDLTLRLQRFYRAQRPAVPHRVRSLSALLDAGARRLGIAAIAAVSVAPRPAPVALAASAHDRQSAIRRCRPVRATAPDVFEGIAPLLEISGYIIATVAALLGILDWQHYGVLVAVALLFGTAATLMALLLSDLSMLRYPRGRDVVLLVAAAVLENCGYRQLNAWWGCVGTVQAMSGGRGWGAIRRQAFAATKKPI